MAGPQSAIPVNDPRMMPQWSAFLELGFRPLYLVGSFWALFSVALWVFVPQLLAGKLPGLYWHMHEMLWAFVGTIAAAFLLTASANWTGIVPLKGRFLGLAVALWIVARIGFLLPWAFGFVLAAVAEVLFYLIAAASVGRVILKVRSKRNYGVPLLLLGLGLSDAWFLWAVQIGDYATLTMRFYYGMLCMAMIALLIARRVIPFFASRGVGSGFNPPSLTETGKWQLGACGLGLFGLVFGWIWLAVPALLVASGISLWQFAMWQPWGTRKVPIVWILYVGYFFLGLGLAVAAVQISGVDMRAAWPVHVIGVGGFSVLIIGMITRTALGHLGRPLRTDTSMVVAYGLVISAALLRFAALMHFSFSVHFLHLATLCWVLGFAVYLWRFVPWLIRPRPDRLPPTGPSMPKVAVQQFNPVKPS
ncbi:Conserved hypothetical protein [gamma proteobacterium HdN1]|nr:Conserved hypothetical protein [gamma proteobacterium HdN1]